MKTHKPIFILLFLLSFPPMIAQAKIESKVSEARLFPVTITGHNIDAALEIKLEKGWKTYWRSPGSDGLKPVFNWEKSENIKNVSILWPTPTIIDQDGIHTIGYVQDVTLPLNITKKDKKKQAILNLDLFYGVCKDLCIPVEESLSLILLQNNITQSHDNSIVARAMENIPNILAQKNPMITCEIKGENLVIKWQKSIDQESLLTSQLLVEAPENFEPKIEKSISYPGWDVTFSSLNDHQKIDLTKVKFTALIKDKAFEWDNCLNHAL